MSKYNDHLDAEIARADQQIRDTRGRVAAHLGRSGPVTGRASSQDGAITVTVGPGGRLVELDIENSALTMKPEQLAAELVRIAQRATRDANGKLHQSVRPVVGRDVADSLTQLGIGPAGDAEPDTDWVELIRRHR